MRSAPEIERWLVAELAAAAGLVEADIDPNSTFASYGLSSTEAVSLAGALEDWTGVVISATAAYDYPTPRLLAAALTALPPGSTTLAPVPAVPNRTSSGTADGAAVIGMGCRFPGGGDGPDRFWEFLSDSAGDGIVTVPAARWDADALYDPDPAAAGKSYVREGGFLDDIAGWDARLFGVSPQEALRIDPQHRLLMEVVWRALEDAGVGRHELRDREVGVFVGLMDSQQYVRLQTEADPRCLEDPYTPMGTAPSVGAGRIAHFFDLHGPTLTVDTACSSSLVACHLALESLARGECNLAVVAAASALVHPDVFLAACRMGMLGRDGRCKTFDRRADGFGIGEGAGCVVLEPVAEAVARRRHIRAVARGSAVNQDGRTNGLTAPNRHAQAQVIRAALKRARVAPEEIAFVETHGSGTELGDAIELQALADVFGDRRERPLMLGAVKTNVGHLLAAAGMVGLLKGVLAVEHQFLTANRNFESANDVLSLCPGLIPAAAPTALTPPAGAPLRAGVSSFGWSGTNAHVVLEQSPPVCAPAPSDGPRVLTLAAPNAQGLISLAADVADLLESGRASLADVAYSLQTGRSSLPHRRAVVAADAAGAVAGCRTAAGGEAPRRAAGVGGQVRPGAAAASYRFAPAFRAAYDQCRAVLQRSGVDVGSLLDSTHPTPSDAESTRAIALCAAYATAGAVLDAGGRLDDLPCMGNIGRLALEAARGGLSLEDSALAVLALDRADDSDCISDLYDIVLDVAAASWEAGADVAWSALCPDEGVLVALPSHPFERTAFWPKAQSTAVGETIPTSRPATRRCYTKTWRQTVVPLGLPDGPVAVLGGSLARAVVRLLSASGVAASLLSDELDYADFADAAVVIDCRAVAAGDDGPGESAVARFTDAMVLLQSLARTATGRGAPRLVVAVAGAFAVVGGDLVDPDAAALVGLARTAGTEYPALRHRLVDVGPADVAESSASAVDLAAEQLVAEAALLEAEVPSGDPVAWRRGRRWVSEVSEVAEACEAGGLHRGLAPSPWRRDGVYLVTGGTRGLGMAMAKHLAQAGVRALALVGRHAIPLSDQGPLLCAVGAGDAPAAAVKDIADLEAVGVQVLPIAADVSNPLEFERAMAMARERFGTLHGVIHCAGIPGRGLLDRKTADQAAMVIATKTAALAPLRRAVEAGELETVVLYSSAVTLLGGLGESDYAAANAVMEAFAESLADTDTKARVLAVAWGPWQHDSWQAAALADSPSLGEKVARYRRQFGLPSAEGTALVDRLLEGPHASVVVLTESAEDARARWSSLHDADGAAPAPDGLRYPRPPLRAIFAPARTPIQQLIARCWAEHLGLEEVGIDDPFFELGGTSLVGVSIVRRLERECGTVLSPSLLFECPTVRELAATIDRLGRSSSDEEGGHRERDRSSRHRQRAAAMEGRRRSVGRDRGLR